MPEGLQICPECGDRYQQKITADKTTVPEDGRVCHHDVNFEGDADTGVWYVHQ